MGFRIGLDFIGGVLEKEPKTRMEIYEMDGIAVRRCAYTPAFQGLGFRV